MSHAQQQVAMPDYEYNNTSYHQQFQTILTPNAADQMKLEALFVGDLSYFCKDEDLNRLFEPYGPVHKAVVRKSKTNEPLHYGFVEVPLMNADKAIATLNGLNFLGRKLRIGIYKTKMEDYHQNLISLHVSFLSRLTNFVVDETFLTKEFSRFGDVQDCVVKQHCSTPSSGSPRQYGYAFVYYANMESATAALEFLQHDSIMNNVKYACNLSHNEHHQPHQQGAPASAHATHHGHAQQHHDGKDRSPSQMAQQLPPSPPLLIPAANMGPAPMPMVMPMAMPMAYPHHGEHYVQPLAPQFVSAPSYMANRPPMPLAYSTRSSSTDSNDAQYMHHGPGMHPGAFVFHPAHQRSPTAAPMMFTAMPMPQHPQSMSSSPPLAQQHSSPPLPPATMARSPPIGEGNLYAMPFPLPPAPLLNAPAGGNASSSPPNAPQRHMVPHPSSPGVMAMMPTAYAPQYAYGAVPLTMPPMAPMPMQQLSAQAMSMPMGMAPQPGQMMMQAPYAAHNANHMKHTNQMRMEQHPQHHAQPHHYQHQPQHSHQAHGGYSH